MTLLRFVSLALVGTVGSYGLSDFPKTASFNVVGDYTIEHDTAIRHQRSTSVAALIVKGNEAVRIILQGARQLPSDKHTVMMFQKPGNLNSALSDFKATKPMPVSYGHKTFPFGPKIYYFNDRIYGQAGDRILRLDKYDPNVGKPVMTIIQKNDSSQYLKVYQVVYTQ